MVYRPDHLLSSNDQPLKWSALESLPFIANGICRLITDEHIQRILAASKLMVCNTTSLLALVRAGVGVTVLPRLAIDQASARLSFLPVADFTAIRRIDILRAAHTAPSPATQAFEGTIRRTARIVPRHHLPLSGGTKGVLC